MVACWCALICSVQYTESSHVPPEKQATFTCQIPISAGRVDPGRFHIEVRPPLKLTCPLKRGHFKKENSLPTTIFLKGDMLVFGGDRSLMYRCQHLIALSLQELPGIVVRSEKMWIASGSIVQRSSPEFLTLDEMDKGVKVSNVG